jgi:hypothetical protein
MSKQQVISLLQLFWKKRVTAQFTPTADQVAYWLNVYKPELIRDAIRVLAQYLQRHEMRGDECILYLGATMRNMRKRRGTANLSRIVIGNSGPDPEDNDGHFHAQFLTIKDLDDDDNSTNEDSDRFGWSLGQDDDSDMNLD